MSLFTEPGRSLRPLAAAVLLATVSCSDATGPEPVAPITELPRELTAAEVGVRDASNAFAFDLSARLLPEGPDENLFWSPLSASMLLAMLLDGADGDTFDQIRGALRLEGMDQEAVNAGYRDLIDLLVDLDPSVTVAVGNALWSETGYPVREAYEERVAGAFDAEIREANLHDPATLEAINGWVDGATRGTIPKILDQMPAGAVFVLLNAIYFNGNWTAAFDPDDTREADFTRPDGSTVRVPLMSREDTVAFGWYDDATVADLSYGGGAFAMTVVVPTFGEELTSLTDGLDRATWDRWIDGLRTTEAVVQIPRFELEWGADLIPPLKALGVTDAFGQGVADFSRMVDGPSPWIGVLRQKAFVRVDEVGTEAAAVTVAVGVDSAPPTLRADRPFLFAIRERLTGTILFMGVVNDPTA